LGDPAGRKRAWWVGLAVVAGLIVFAYGFAETEVNLDQIRSETRREGLVRILRSLARPELIEYDLQDTITDSPVLIPCQEGASTSPPSAGDRVLTMDPPCAEPRAEVTIEGFGFSANQQIRLSFVPGSAVELRLADVRSDAEGHFSAVVRLPNRPDENAQTIRAVSSEPVGSPRFTTTARETLEKIIETVFMALVATTFATFLAVPLSFFAARNLMENITSPLTNVAMGLIAAPFGIAGGVLAARGASLVADNLTETSAFALIGLVVTPVIAWRLVRIGLPAEETTRPTPGQRAFRALLLVVAIFLAVLALYLAADLLQVAGNSAAPYLGVFGFLSQFFATVGELLEFGVIVVAALFGAGALVMLSNRLGHGLRRRLPSGVVRSINFPLSMAAGAVVAVLVARAIAWFYEWSDAARTTWIPIAIGATIGLLLAFRSVRKDAVNVGLGTYYVTRTVFNVLRAIEPLIMAIVFVVWVGIGPFAGALALGFHTIAALAKLYSEQVESIASGPLEAIRATGANRLQTVVYAVVPQVIPPYISFTMYRWDINVRMSTIIGFVGGGGIGFLLQQNINLLNYRAAAAQILAIAIVVSAMDWLSSKIRQRYV
jgi:phosphonate ABC transporter permease subunit PhnE